MQYTTFQGQAKIVGGLAALIPTPLPEPRRWWRRRARGTPCRHKPAWYGAARRQVELGVERGHTIDLAHGHPHPPRDALERRLRQIAIELLRLLEHGDHDAFLSLVLVQDGVQLGEIHHLFALDLHILNYHVDSSLPV
jgi:hypothetical protein